MKPTTRNALIGITGMLVGAVGVFSTPLGLPDWLIGPCSAIMAGSIWLTNWLHKRDKRRGLVAPPVDAPRQNRRLTLYLLIGLFAGCVIFTVADPYLGISQPLRFRIIWSVVIFAVSASIILIVRRHHHKT